MVFTELQAKLSLDASGFKAGVSDARQGLDKLSDRASSVGRSMQRTGSQMTAGLTAPLAGAAGASAKFAADFDQSMQKSIAVMGDVDDTMREDLEKTARDVATSMSVSHDEAAQSFYYLASAGLDAAESMEAMPKVAAFAEAGQMDMAEATDVATNVMSAYGLEAEEMSKVTDTMTATVTNHNQTMQGMSAAFQNAAPAAASMGVEMEELAAMTGRLGDVGIQGAEAGTALNSIMRRMAKRSGEAGKALDKLGIKTTDAQGNLLPLTDIIEQLENANMSAAESSAIFGRQMSAGNALVSAGADQLRQYQSRLKESEGATESVANTQRDTLNAQLNILKSNLQDAAITFGNEFIPVLNRLVARLKPVAEMFQQLNSRQRKIIVVTAAVVAAIGPLLVVLGTFMTLLPGIISALGALGTAIAVLTGPIGLVVAAVGLLAAAFAKDFMGIRTATENAVSAIISTLQPFMNLLRGEAIETMNHWRNVFSDTLAFLEALWSAHGETVMSILRPLFETLRLLVEGMLDGIITLVRVALAVLRGDWKDAWNILAGFMDRQVGRFRDIARHLGRAVVNAVKAIGGQLRSAGRGLIDALVDGIRDKIDDVRDAADDVADTARSYLPGSDAETGPLSDLTDSGAALPETLASGMESNEQTVEQASKRTARKASPDPSADPANLPAAGAGSEELVAELHVDGNSAIEALFDVLEDDIEAKIKRREKSQKRRSKRLARRS